MGQSKKGAAKKSAAKKEQPSQREDSDSVAPVSTVPGENVVLPNYDELPANLRRGIVPQPARRRAA